MLKLNLGCGDRKIHGFVNIDARKEVCPDKVLDITRIDEYYADVELIYACHVLEHFPKTAFTFQPTTYKEVLQSWYNCLADGGVLRLAVPDFRAVCAHYNKTGDLEVLHTLLYGGQKYDFDFHYHTWDYPALKKDLHEVGFKKVNSYCWQETEHSYIDDYSQAYLPHMDKATGRLMSLNVEAAK
jgi:hypothetical protein